MFQIMNIGEHTHQPLSMEDSYFYGTVLYIYVDHMEVFYHTVNHRDALLSKTKQIHIL